MRVPDGRIFDVAPRTAPLEIAEEEPEEPQPTDDEPAPAAEAPVSAQADEPQPAEAVPEFVVEAPAAEAPANQAADEPQPVQREPEPADVLPVAAFSTPAPAPPVQKMEHRPAAAVPEAVSPKRSRALPVALVSLAGAGIGLIANAFPHLVGQPAMGKLAILAPETVGVQILIAAVAILLVLGRIREQLAQGLLLGFGLLTVAGAIGLVLVVGEIGAELGAGPLVLLAGGAAVLIAAIVGILGDNRAREVADAQFRWVRASLLAVAGAAVGFIALFVPFGRLEDGSSASVIKYGTAGLTGNALEPIVAIAAASFVAYALGREGGRRLLAAGIALALGAQTALYYGSWFGGILAEEYLKPELGWGCIIGFAAAALLLGAGLSGRRSPGD